MEQTVDRYLNENIPGAVRDMNVHTFHSCSYLDMQCLRDELGGKAQVDEESRRKTTNLEIVVP